ncbi:MAG: HAD family phosphatase [Burkholderiaceae bacterium]
MPTRAFLFDLDGTLIHSMPLHQRSWRLWHAEQGLAFDEVGFFEATAGRTNTEILAELFPRRPRAEREALAERKEQLYRELAAGTLQLIDGFAGFHAEARAAGLKLAICTAAPRANMAVAFARFGLDDMVDAITSPADGLRGKPQPDIFVEAARRIGVPPADCVVFEDAPLGVEAARRGGMRAVALTTTLPALSFAAFDNIIATAPDFTALDVAALLRQQPQVTPHA